MSEQDQENKETNPEGLSLDKKIELDKSANPDSYKAEDNGEDVNGLIKKKNELLNEKKKQQMLNKELQDELDRMKGMLRQQEDEKLEEKQEYKTLWENTQKEKEETEKKYFMLQDSLVKEKKIKEFNKALGTPLSNDRYYELVNFDTIVVDDDGTINKDSVKYAVNLLRENYPEVISKGDFPKVGSQAASNNGITNTNKFDVSSAEARRNEISKRLRQNK